MGTDELTELLTRVAPMFPITTGQSCPDYADVHFGGEGHSSQAMTMNPEHWDALNALHEAVPDLAREVIALRADKAALVEALKFARRFSGPSVCDKIDATLAKHGGE